MYNQLISTSSSGVYNPCDPLHSQTQNLVAGETHIEIDVGTVCQRDDRNKRTLQLKAFKFLTFGVALVGLFALFATRTIGQTKQHIVATNRTVEFASKHDCKDGDPCNVDKKNQVMKCAATWGGCMDTKCCESAGMQCYGKDKYWAVCKGSCTKEHATTHEKWTCDKIGKRDWAKALTPLSKKNGYPSLFCFTYIRGNKQEVDLVKSQLENQFGIFACDGFAVVSDKKIVLGKLPYGGVWGNYKDPIRTIKLDDVGTTDVNFIANIWNAIGQDRTYRDHDWTVKVDSDAVLLPGRLRVHLKEKTFEDASQYVKNCAKDSEVKGRKLNEKRNKDDDNEKGKEDEEDENEKDDNEEKPVKKEKHEKKAKKARKEDMDKKNEEVRNKTGVHNKTEEKKEKHEKEGTKGGKVRKNKKDKNDKNEDENADEIEESNKEGAKGGKDRKNKKDRKDTKEDENGEEDEENNPFMIASFQIVSVSAMNHYSADGDDCKDEAKWRKWTADNFMEKCLDFLAVSSVEIHDSLMDVNCKGVNCADPWVAMFRNNFYTKDAWLNCLHKAMGS